jgi:hypothetical protein
MAAVSAEGSTVWVFVRRHRLGIFGRAAGLEIGGYAGHVEHMAALLDIETDICRAPAEAVAIHSHNRSRLAVRDPHL